MNTTKITYSYMYENEFGQLCQYDVTAWSRVEADRFMRNHPDEIEGSLLEVTEC